MKLKLILALAIVVALMAFTAATALAAPPTEFPGNRLIDVCNLSGGHAVFCR